MDAGKRESDRRGDRRGEWRCQNPRCLEQIGGGVVHDWRDGPPVPAPVELEDGKVVCSFCRTIDRRSTEGNRRRAELELRALCERIERELGDARGRLDDVESSAEYLVERVDRHGAKLEDVGSRLYQVERKAESAEYTADEAKREAENARREAERAGRGW